MQKFTHYLKDLLKIFHCSAVGFIDDKALKMSASLAYTTIFSLSPLLVLVISLTSIVYEKSEDVLFEQIRDFVGTDAAAQIRSVIEQSNLTGGSTISLVISVIVLLIGSTAIFTEIQDSLNTIWRVRPKPKKGFQKFLLNRVLSFSLIISLGFLLIVSLLINLVVAALSDRLTRYFPDTTLFLVDVFNICLTFTIISTLFAIIFKFLPDVKITWKNVRTGAFATAILFMLGRYLIGIYLTTAGTGSAFGAAGSVIVILTWVYYTAAILYFGAEFTQVYAEKFGGKIEPAEYAVSVVQVEKERDVAVLPPQNPELDKAK